MDRERPRLVPTDPSRRRLIAAACQLWSPWTACERGFPIPQVLPQPRCVLWVCEQICCRYLRSLDCAAVHATQTRTAATSILSSACESHACLSSNQSWHKQRRPRCTNSGAHHICTALCLSRSNKAQQKYSRYSRYTLSTQWALANMTNTVETHRNTDTLLVCLN